MQGLQLRHELAHYTGCEQPFRHPLYPRVTYTDGVQFFLQNAGNGAYWLLDILATQPEILEQAKEFASIKLKVVGTSATLTVTDGNDGTPIAYERQIEFTDCPEGEWKFYFIGNMIMLPSEY